VLLLQDVVSLVLQKLILKDKKSPWRSRLLQLLLMNKMFSGKILPLLQLVSKLLHHL
jgi:hypothetical protein